MRTILVVGIGAGNPEHITIQAINALNRADVLFVPLKGEEKVELAELRREMIRRYVTAPVRVVEFELPVRDATNPSYAQGVADWHDAIARLYARLMADELGDAGIGAMLVWGDPSLYDSTLRILERVSGLGTEFAVAVIPGVSSLHALTAAHAIPLNRIGEPVLLTTGRRLGRAPATDAAVLLDGRLAFGDLEAGDWDIYWGAYLGSADEILVAGPLAEVAAEIEAKRAEARRRHGWIMDTYLLRRRGSDAADDKGAVAE